MAVVSCCSGSTLSRFLCLRPFPVSVPSSHLRTRHSPDRPTIRAAAKPSPYAAVRSGFPFLQASWGKSSNIGGGGGGSMAGDRAEDDMSIEGFRELDGIVQWLRRLLQQQRLEGAPPRRRLLHHYELFDRRLRQAEASNYGGKNAEEHALVPIVPNNTTNFRSSYSDKNSGMEIAKKRATNSPIDHVGIGIPDDENDSDENGKKMKGRHGFVLNTAIASLPCLGFLIPYWTFFCSNANFDTWKDITPTGHLVLTIISLILIVLCMTVIIWMNYFQPTEMVIKRIKTMFKKATQWLGNLSLPECITAKFKKVQGTQRPKSAHGNCLGRVKWTKR
ncbi:hypothetical protein ZWY2020_017786 [Hordeum vulgare]|nr:hypothetical protein ZWY2020_017786 [Hordeum vulgare]